MRIPSASRWASPFIVAVVAVAGTAHATASEPAVSPVPVQTLAERDLDLADAELFFAELLSSKLAEHDIPGATLAVVKDGAVLLSAGYGLADVASNRPVVASETLFRIGSVSKLVTWTAVMQLVEQEKIDLHADVNGYLGDFAIPATFPQPITMADLMTHTAGFEERQLGISVVDPSVDRPLAAFLASDMPARIYPPASVTAYSNYGAALAAYIVERVSGERFEEYVQRHILEPLEMRDSTYEQALPRALAANLATSYQSVSGKLQPMPQEYFELIGAAGISATATDMANFMMAHLNDGRFGAMELLSATTTRDMHQQHFTNERSLAGMTYGFAELPLNPQTALIHTGSTNFEQFHSYLVLVPDDDVGLFVSLNGEGGADAKHEIVEAFLDRYYPQPTAPPAEAIDGSLERAAQFAGFFQPTRANESTLEKIVGLVTPAIEVVANADGTLTITGGPVPAGARWVEVEPLLFRQIDGWDVVAFREDADGEVTSMFIGSLPIVGFTVQPWWQSGPLHLGLLATSMLVFLTAIVALPIAGLVALRRRTRRGSAVGAHAIAWLTSALFVAFAITFAVGIADLEAGIGAVARASLLIAIAAAVLTVGLLVGVAIAWKNRSGGIVGRIYLSIVALSAVAFVWFLNYWNLLGFRL